MPLCLLSTRPPSSLTLITCHASSGALRTHPSPPSTSSLSLPPTPPPSLTCALHCPHFQSYAPFSLSHYFFFFFFFVNRIITAHFSFQLFQFLFFRCSGCTHEFNLHRPIIVDEATDFFNTLGVSDFTFDTCRLVHLIIPSSLISRAF